MIARRQPYFSPGRLVLLSIILTIIFGTLLLMMPMCQKTHISMLDCFFTATSSTCVTGVLTVPFESFTLLGKLVILLLIQVGGIGLVTLSLFLMSLFTNLGLSAQLMGGHILELETWKNTKQIVMFITSVTLISEAIGAILIYFTISSNYNFSEAIFHSVFHSISSFCSAGLSSFDNSLINFQDNIFMLLITGLLILLGTIGFIPLHELFSYIKNRNINKRHTFSLTTKVIASMTVILIFVATFLLIILEGHHFSDKPWWIKVSNMLFNAIAYRSTGLTTIDINIMQAATVFMIMMYSLIGSSPGSTGSGIKVTSFAIFLATIRAVMTGRTVVDLKGRKIPNDQIFKAMAILSLSFCWVILSTFFLLLLESKSSFINVFFETVSSFTTLGLATDMTPYLSYAGKLLIIANMFIGRVGSLTLILALRAKTEKTEFQYPEERIMIS